MICKKCGANIADTSKFCGYCGNQIEQVTVSNEVPVQNIEQQIVQSEVTAPKVEQPVVQTEVPDQQMAQNIGNESIATVSSNKDVEKVVEPANFSQEPTNNSSKQKNNKSAFVVLGVVLAVVAVVLLVLVFNKSSNNSAAVLQKAVANLGEKSVNNGTVIATVTLEEETSGSINISATSKYAKVGDKYNFQVTLNKNLFFEEMSVYLTFDEKNADLYAQSNVVDMVGLTSSDTIKWLHYTLDLAEAGVNVEETKNYDIEFSNVIDNKHFVYVNKEGNLRNYQLIIDEELIKNLKSELSKIDDQEVKDTLSALEEEDISFDETYKVDFYINEEDEVVRVSMDLTEMLEDQTITKAIVSVEFVDLGSTTVTIPEEALNSSTDLTEYFTTNSISYDDEYESDLDYSLEY